MPPVSTSLAPSDAQMEAALADIVAFSPHAVMGDNNADGYSKREDLWHGAFEEAELYLCDLPGPSYHKHNTTSSPDFIALSAELSSRALITFLAAGSSDHQCLLCKVGCEARRFLRTRRKWRVDPLLRADLPERGVGSTSFS